MPRFNTDNSTNAALAVMGAIELFEKLSGHPLPTETKATLLEVFLAVGLWFTGKPSPATGKILKHLGLKNDLVDSVANDRATGIRSADMGATRPQSADYGDAGLGAGTLERLANDGDYDRGSDRVNPTARAAEYWQRRPSDVPVVGSPTIEGTGMSAVEFSVRSQAGDADDNSYSMPIQGGGEWQN